MMWLILTLGVLIYWDLTLGLKFGEDWKKVDMLIDIKIQKLDYKFGWICGSKVDI